jgi:branched-chain amino acid transport system permease protein
VLPDCALRDAFAVRSGACRHEAERRTPAFFGYRVQLYKALIFSFAGLIAGLSGALFAYHQGFIGPGSMGPGLSTTAVLYCLFGGTGT